MKNRCGSILMFVHSLMIAVVICMFTVLMSAGCSADGETPPAELPFYPVVVYDDGVYAVECTDLSVEDSADGTGKAALRLRVTNNSTDCVALSSVLGIRVAADGKTCMPLPNRADRTPVDGLIDAGSCRDGWITVQIPVEAESFTIEMAVNYLDDQWLCFTISR